MTLLEEVTKAAAAAERPRPRSQAEFPVVLNPEFSLVNLKPKAENPNPASLVCPLTPWKVSEADAALASAIFSFSDGLRFKLKEGKRFGQNEFLRILTPFLEQVLQIAGVSAGVAPSDRSYVKVLIERVGGLLGKEASSLVLDACLMFELWELVECMIVRGIVDRASYGDVILRLMLKRRSDLICLCISHATDIRVTELLCVLRYFCCPPKDAFPSMARVRKEWESQGMLAIRMAGDKNQRAIESDVAVDAAILLMVAYDEFLAPEICLHYLLASSSIDEAVLSSAISKLNDEEVSSLIRYLGKWLKKYERFPQACPCPKALSSFELGALVWVPKLEDVVRWVGLILDVNFSSLVLHPEFHEELRLIQTVVASLAGEAKASSSLANIVDGMMNAS
ncbi:hypothetical protein MLD38_011368 [Melastoma candidum]|uniref:Uncharacterized protein n=1 Tax=Melastoma candidum TaxID=119954 RepID=A0ACB9R6Z7_9MYRT|nr:hypothetical protein MLD38_011368 [Melastoma candidum]